MKTALIIGSDSMIGAALATELTARGVTVHTTQRQLLDLASSPDSWPLLPQADVAYICAAIAKLETCEQDPLATRLVNVTHTQALMQKLQLQGAHVVFLSSNQVFDGNVAFRKTTESTCPVNEYGRQKAEAEKGANCVLRLTKVLAAPLLMMAQWKESLAKGEVIEAFDDLVFAPLPLASVTTALCMIGQEKCTGILHLSGARDISYYELACALAGNAGKVRAISARSKAIPSNFLPKYTTLTSSFPDIPVAVESLFH